MKGLNVREFIAREGERLGIRKQEELAKRLGVSDQTISNWVKGKTFPTHQMEVQLYEMGMTTEEMLPIIEKMDKIGYQSVGIE